MITISKNYRKSNALTLERFNQGMGMPVLLGILFFFIVALGSADSIEGLVLIAAVFMLIVIAARFSTLRDRIHLPMLALTLYVLMDGISTFYAVSGKFALREFLKVLLAFMLAVILLAASPKKEEQKGKRIATILAVCTAVGSLVGIDMYATGKISGAVIWVLSRFTEAYGENKGVEMVVLGYTRMASLFDNANIYAGFGGLGVILSVGLADTANSRKERCFYLPVLFLDMVAFALTISLGAFFFAFFALIAFILMHHRENQLRTWALLIETLVLAVAVVLLFFKLDAHPWLRLVIVVIGAVALCGIDLLAGKRIRIMKGTSEKTALIASVACIVLVAAYAAAGLTVGGNLDLSGTKTVGGLFPKPGGYTLAVEAEGDPLTVTVFSQSLEQSAMGSQTELYSGNAAGANFTVPEDSLAVFFTLQSEGETHISGMSYGKHKVLMRYALLPDYVAEHIGGPGKLLNATLRLIYFRDGIKLFKRSPIIGLGMGAFENAIKGVQSFYYETKYAHNHYFQTMLETGIIGLILFLFLLISSAIAIWKSRKEQPFAPMLAALWMFMAGQALHDIVFSAYAYLPLAYGSFALIDLCCGAAIKKPKLSKTVQCVVIGVTCVGTVVYCIFIAGNMLAKRNIEKEPTMQMLTRCVELDRFEWADYALPYVNNAIGDNVNPYVSEQADIYAERLSKVNSNTIPIYLAEYYFNSERPEQGIAMLEKYVDYISSDSRGWESAFSVLRGYDDGSELFRDGAVHLKEMMDTWNAENIGTVQVSDELNAYIAARTA